MHRPYRMAASAAFVAALALPLPVLAAGTASADPRDCVAPVGMTYAEALDQREIAPDCQREDVTYAPASTTPTTPPRATSSSAPPTSTPRDTTPASPRPVDTTPDSPPVDTTPESAPDTPPSSSTSAPVSTPSTPPPGNATPGPALPGGGTVVAAPTTPRAAPVLPAPAPIAPPVARPGTAAGTIDPALLGGAPAAGLDPSLLMSPGGGAGGLASVLGADTITAGFVTAPLPALGPAAVTTVDLRPAADSVTTSSRIDALPERSRSQVETSTVLAFVLGGVLAALVLRRAVRSGRR